MIVVVVVIPGAKLGTHDPEVVHVFAAGGAEASDNGTARAFRLGRMSSGIRTHDGLSPLGTSIVDAGCNFVERAAFADSFVDRSAGAATQAA